MVALTGQALLKVDELRNAFSESDQFAAAVLVCVQLCQPQLRNVGNLLARPSCQQRVEAMPACCQIVTAVIRETLQ
jgi:hypothetical protein